MITHANDLWPQIAKAIFRLSHVKHFTTLLVASDTKINSKPEHRWSITVTWAAKKKINVIIVIERMRGLELPDCRFSNPVPVDVNVFTRNKPVWILNAGCVTSNAHSGGFGQRNLHSKRARLRMYVCKQNLKSQC